MGLLHLNKEKYIDYMVKENPKKVYSSDKKYLNQEKKLLKTYGRATSYEKEIKMIVISDTHNCLKEEEFKQFINEHKDYQVCLLLGDHSLQDINILLKYIDKNKIYGLLGNHDENYLQILNIPDIHGKIVDINGTTILGVKGSYKYKPGSFPSFTQQESILLLKDKPKVDILVSHDNRLRNSINVDPAHQGLFGITYYLFKNKIPYHIHGHLHHSYQQELINGTKELSVFMFEYIELHG